MSRLVELRYSLPASRIRAPSSRFPNVFQFEPPKNAKSENRRKHSPSPVTNDKQTHQGKHQDDSDCTFRTKVEEFLAFREVYPLTPPTPILLAAFADRNLLPNTESVRPQRQLKCGAALRALLIMNEYHLPSPNARTRRSMALIRPHRTAQLMAAASSQCQLSGSKSKVAQSFALQKLCGTSHSKSRRVRNSRTLRYPARRYPAAH